MPPSLTNLKRYRDLARLLWKYGRSDVVRQMAAQGDLGEPDADLAPAKEPAPEELADDLEALGPTFVKLGQVLSSRPDLLPEAYSKALSRLQDKVKPFSFEEVSAIVERELGARLSKAFSRFDPQPVAAASLGQVHLAALRDGRPVVVKVQRPDIHKQITEDFEVLEQLAHFVDAHTEIGRRYRFRALLEEMRISIQHELDYEREAQNLIALGANLKEFERIQVPQPIAGYGTRTVLTMEYVSGRKISAVGSLGRIDMDGAPLAEELFKAYLKQVLVDGLFHADPHPGNVFLTDDGRLALLDLGMVGHATPGMQEHLLKLLLAVSDGQGEDVAEIIIRISEKTEEPDPAEFRRRVGRLIASRRDVGLRQARVGMTLLEGARAAADTGYFVPSELTLLGKTLLQLEEIGSILDPAFDPNPAIRRNVNELMTQRMRKQATSGSAVSSLLEMKEFAVGLPRRLNKLMDAVANHEVELKVRAVDASRVMENLQSIANRIATAIVLAALIMGASILMQVQTSFRILGYPGLAILCFLAAAAGGFWLVASIFLNDQRRRGR